MLVHPPEGTVSDSGPIPQAQPMIQSALIVVIHHHA